VCVVKFRPDALCNLNQSWTLNVDNKPIWRFVLPCVGYKIIYRSFLTTMSQLKICDFSGETFKGFEVL